MKRRFFINHTISQNESPAWTYSWFYNTPSVKMFVPQNKLLVFIFSKKLVCLIVGVQKIGQVYGCCKIMCRWVMTNCCSMSDIILSQYICKWWSQWQRGLMRGSAAARLLGLRVRIPPRAWMFVSCKCSVLSGLCVGPITRPEEWCLRVIVKPR